MKNILQNILKFLLFLSVGLVILYFVYQNQNEAYQAQCAIDGVAAADCSLIQKVINDFKSVNLFWIFLAFGAYLISNFSRALRWKMLLKPLGRDVKLHNAFLTVMLGYFANLGLPRLGEVLRPLSLSKYEKIPLEKVLGTIVVDRMMDVISLLLIVGLAFILQFDTLWGYLSSNMNTEQGGSLLTNPIVLSIAGSGIGSIVLAFIFRKKIQSTQLYQKVIHLLQGFWDGISSVRKLDRPWLFLVHCFVIWVGYYLMFYFYLPAFGPTENLGFVAALMVFVFGTFGIVIPSPGGMGSYHFLVIAALGLYGISGGDAFSSANISFFGTHFGNIVLGLMAVILLPILNKNYDPSKQAQNSKSQITNPKLQMTNPK